MSTMDSSDICPTPKTFFFFFKEIIRICLQINAALLASYQLKSPAVTEMMISFQFQKCVGCT